MELFSYKEHQTTFPRLVQQFISTEATSKTQKSSHGIFRFKLTIHCDVMSCSLMGTDVSAKRTDMG
jgi:hypothetical protein